MKRTIVLALILCLVIAGLIRVTAKEDKDSETLSEIETTPDTALNVKYEVINAGYDKLKPVFIRGCFDCHSAKTEYPWYHKLPLIGGWMDGHIEEAREHLDMTDGFPFKGEGNQVELLEELWDEIEEGDMPLFSYRLMHWDASPDDTEEDSIKAWVERSVQLISIEFKDGK